eukprot:11569271-Alexandrium_andersonii.AAC.1
MTTMQAMGGVDSSQCLHKVGLAWSAEAGTGEDRRLGVALCFAHSHARPAGLGVCGCIACARGCVGA